MRNAAPRLSEKDRSLSRTVRASVLDVLKKTGSMFAASEEVVRSAMEHCRVPDGEDWNAHLTDKQIAIARAAGQEAIKEWKRERSV